MQSSGNYYHFYELSITKLKYGEKQIKKRKEGENGKYNNIFTNI